jgi:WD40 repeat protein
MGDLVAINAANVLELHKIYQWTAHENHVTSLVFMSDSNELVSTSQNGSNRVPAVRLWDVSSGSINPEGGAFVDAVASGVTIPQVQLNENGRILTAAHAGVTLWDARTRQRVGNILTPASSAFQYDYNNVIVGGRNGVVSLWTFNVPYGPYGEYRESGILPEDYVFSPTPSEMITAFQVGDEIVQVAHADDTSFILTRSGTLLTHTLGGGTETLITVTQDAREEQTEPLAENGILMVVRRENQHIIYAGAHQDMLVYDYKHQQNVLRVPIHAEVGCIAFDSMRQLLVVGDANGLLHFFDAETYAAIGQVDVHHPVTACAFNQDGTLLATGSAEGQIAFWGTSS